MKTRSLWGKEDIIGLSLYHSIHGPRLRAIISTYDSLDTFCRIGLSKPLFHDSISDIIAEIRDIGHRHIASHEEQGIIISTFDFKRVSAKPFAYRISTIIVVYKRETQ